MKNEMQEADGVQAAIDAAVRSYNPTEAALHGMAEQARGLRVASLDDKEGLAAVREARLTLKGARVAIEKKRVELKADALAFGRAVDTEAKRLTAIIEPEETRLASEEGKVEAERQRIRLAKLDGRMLLLKPYARIGMPTPHEVEPLSDEAFATLVERERDTFLAAEAERAKAEAERREREAAEAAAREVERQRLAVEAQRQAEERARMAAERAEIEAAQRAEAAKVAAERAEIEAERRAEADRMAAERAAIEAERAKVAQAQREHDARVRAEAEAKARAQREAEDRAAEEARKPERDRVAAFAARVDMMIADVPPVWCADAIQTALMRCRDTIMDAGGLTQ